jgi:hypothetical protein
MAFPNCKIYKLCYFNELASNSYFLLNNTFFNFYGFLLSILQCDSSLVSILEQKLPAQHQHPVNLNPPSQVSYICFMVLVLSRVFHIEPSLLASHLVNLRH